jgi:hypothetical protein
MIKTVFCARVKGKIEKKEKSSRTKFYSQSARAHPIILQLLEDQPMHGCKIITSERFSACISDPALYPFLGTLEKKGFLESKRALLN